MRKSRWLAGFLSLSLIWTSVPTKASVWTPGHPTRSSPLFSQQALGAPLAFVRPWAPVILHLAALYALAHWSGHSDVMGAMFFTKKFKPSKLTAKEAIHIFLSGGFPIPKLAPTLRKHKVKTLSDEYVDELKKYLLGTHLVDPDDVLGALPEPGRSQISAAARHLTAFLNLLGMFDFDEAVEILRANGVWHDTATAVLKAMEKLPTEGYLYRPFHLRWWVQQFRRGSYSLPLRSLWNPLVDRYQQNALRHSSDEKDRYISRALVKKVLAKVKKDQPERIAYLALRDQVVEDFMRRASDLLGTAQAQRFYHTFIFRKIGARVQPSNAKYLKPYLDLVLEVFEKSKQPKRQAASLYTLASHPAYFLVLVPVQGQPMLKRKQILASVGKVEVSADDLKPIEVTEWLPPKSVKTPTKAKASVKKWMIILLAGLTAWWSVPVSSRQMRSAA